MQIRSIMLTFLIAMITGLAFGAEKPPITFIVHLNEKAFDSTFHPAIPDMERHLADTLAAYLNERIPVFHFQRIGRAADTLIVKFSRTGDTDFYSVNFAIGSSGLHSRETSSFAWPCV